MFVGSPFYDSISKTTIFVGLIHPTMFINFIDNFDFLVSRKKGDWFGG